MIHLPFFKTICMELPAGTPARNGWLPEPPAPPTGEIAVHTTYIGFLQLWTSTGKTSEVQVRRKPTHSVSLYLEGNSERAWVCLCHCFENLCVFPAWSILPWQAHLSISFRHGSLSAVHFNCIPRNHWQLVTIRRRLAAGCIECLTSKHDLVTRGLNVWVLGVVSTAAGREEN